MQTFTTSALFLSTLLVPALAVAQYGSPASSASHSSSAAATTTSTGSSATHTVQVGADGFVFTPDSVDAAVGEILEFHYTGSNLHDVVQGPFSSPCSDTPTGIYSGYVSTSDVFQVTVNSTSPMWLYCSTPGHCQGGMVMVVNQASSGANTLAAYKSAAQGTSGSNAPSSPQGGTVIAINKLSQGSSSASGSASASMSAAASSSSMASSGAGQTISSAFQKIAIVVGLPVLAWLTN